MSSKSVQVLEGVNIESITSKNTQTRKYDRVLQKREIHSTGIRIVSVLPYPIPGHKHQYESGVAPYAKDLLEAMKNYRSELEICVISEKKEGVPDTYIENGIIIYRIYKKNLLYPISISNMIARLKPTVVHIQHEYFLYGDTLSVIIFPILLLLCRLYAKKVIVTLHGVIPLEYLEDKNFRLENNLQGTPILLKIGILLVTKLISTLSHTVLVLEEFLKQYLMDNYHVNPMKIVVIPHGVSDIKLLSSYLAKRKLGIECKIFLLFFGHITPYKGLDLLLETYRDVIITLKLSDTVLVIAGGPHPRLKDQRQYKEWLQNLIRRIREIELESPESARIILTGFLEEYIIPLYFSAADIVILPYKYRFAASAAEAVGISYQKIVIIPAPGLLLKAHNLSTLIKDLLIQREKYIEKSIKLKNERSWRNIAQRHLEVYNMITT